MCVLGFPHRHTHTATENLKMYRFGSKCSKFKPPMCINVYHPPPSRPSKAAINLLEDNSVNIIFSFSEFFFRPVFPVSVFFAFLPLTWCSFTYLLCFCSCCVFFSLLYSFLLSAFLSLFSLSLQEFRGEVQSSVVRSFGLCDFDAVQCCGWSCSLHGSILHRPWGLFI